MDWFGQTKRLLVLGALLLCPLIAWAQQPVIVNGSGGTPATVKPAATGSTANDTAIVTTLSPLSGVPLITVKGGNKATSLKTVSVASVVVAAHQTIIVEFGSGNWAATLWSAAVTDGTNTYVIDSSNVQGTTAYAAIFRASNATAGTYTITATISGTNSANTTVQMQVYVADGLLTPATSVDAVASGANAGSTSASTSSVYPEGPNEIAFSAVAVAANSTVTATAPWTADYTNADATLSFGSLSQILSTQDAVAGGATLGTSGAWAMALATYETPASNIQGTVGIQIQGIPLVPAAAGVPLVGIEGHAGGAVDGATAASVPANAILQGARAATAYPTAVTDGQLVSPMADKAGRPAVVLNAPRDLTAAVSVQTTTASLVSFVAAGATGVFNDITTFTATDESATATIISLSDGTTTYKYALAGNGGIVINFPTPLPATSTATAWQISNSAAVTVDCTAVYVKNK